VYKRQILEQALGLDFAKIQTASTECLMQVVILNRDGSVRANAEARLVSLLQVLGVSVPLPQSTGTGKVPLTHPPDSQVFTLPVTVQSRQKSVQQNFLLDTGASATIIGDPVLQQLGLRGTPIPSKLLTYSVVGDDCDRVRVSVLPLPTLKVDRATVKNISGMGLNPVPAQLAGVLGMDFLSNYNMYLHPQQKLLQLSERRSPPPDPDLLPLTGKLGVMLTPARINDRSPSPFLLDTGADVMVIGESYAKQLGIDLKGAPEIEVMGFCGRETAKRVTLASVQVGSHRLTNLDAVVIQGKVLNLLGVKGIIGQNFLNRYEQHWYFADRNSLGYAPSGFLKLTPIE
jgi:clan AA aspartic protease (TIGR02281 family)